MLPARLPYSVRAWSWSCQSPLALGESGGRVAIGRVVGTPVRPRGTDVFPADFGERRTGREPLDQVGIGDVGPAGRDHVSSSSGHIPALGVRNWPLLCRAYTRF